MLAIPGGMGFVDLPDIAPLTGTVIGAAVEVHRHLGAGMLESVYLACLSRELKTGRLRLNG
jgi:GxxExxY protein